MGWTWYGPDKMSTRCNYIDGGAEPSAKDCRAACNANPNCNVVNHHPRLGLCEQYDCHSRGVGNPGVFFNIPGWNVYVWEAGLSLHWETTAWCAQILAATSLSPPLRPSPALAPKAVRADASRLLACGCRGECMKTNFSSAVNEDCANPSTAALTYDSASPSTCNGWKDITCAP